METIELLALDDLELSAALVQRRVALWVLPGCTEAELKPLLCLPWSTVWNASAEIDIEGLFKTSGDGRDLIVVDRPDNDVNEIRISEFIRIYQICQHPRSVKASPSRARAVHITQLKAKVEHLSGALVFVGPAVNATDDVALVAELAPQLRLVIFNDISAGADFEGRAYRWSGDAASFSRDYARLIADTDAPNILSLKDAESVEINPTLYEDVSKSWTVFSRGLVHGGTITQDGFDRFLKGDDAWPLFAANVAYPRQNACHSLLVNAWPGEQVDFVLDVVNQVLAMEQQQNEPSQQLKHIRLFSEAGSGATTMLRQAAMALARRGYPTLFGRPFQRSFDLGSVERFVIAVQDEWLRQRKKGRGSGVGLIPVCLFLDTDSEEMFNEQKLARRLTSIGRRIIIIRALEKSYDELEESANVYALPAETTDSEVVAIGSHLHRFCTQYGLAKLPGESEWHAYYDGISRLTHIKPFSGATTKDVQRRAASLFLVGLHPFVKERVTDANSLAQYYYRKWNELGSDGLKDFVRVLAEAGVYGISLPYSVLRRHEGLNLSEIEGLPKHAMRKLDVLVSWLKEDRFTWGWSLHIRHPIIGRLLSGAIDPLSGMAPFSALVGLLKGLGTNEDDLWVADKLAYRLGAFFGKQSNRFSLETDTPVQRASRAIFAAIPMQLKQMSRTVRHHEGRYHMHVLRACGFALKHQSTTTLSKDDLVAIQQSQFKLANENFDLALSAIGRGESASNVHNTKATNLFSFAEEISNPGIFRETFTMGLDVQEKAILLDPANGHALFQFTDRLLRTVPEHEAWTDDEKLEIYARAEEKIVQLMQLHSEKRWRNTDPAETEFQLGKLLQDYRATLESLPNVATRISAFKAKNPEAALLLEARLRLGRSSSLEEALRDPAIARDIRRIRSELLVLAPKSSRSLLYVYRLYVADPEDRLRFDDRLRVLGDLMLVDPDQFNAYRHDRAALLCQIDNLVEGARSFSDLRAFRKGSGAQWLWHNEHVLLKNDGSGALREITLQVTDPQNGWARVIHTDVKIKYQPYQFGSMVKGQPFKAFIRFTMNTLQAVGKELANIDRQEMRLR